MTITVFYSWQSNLPNRTNRGFIQRALEKAIANLNLESSSASRDEIVLDMDTSGVPGHPPITETILAKIAECDIFVADMSFVGSSADDRPIPNPNVLIEYGSASSQSVGKPLHLDRRRQEGRSNAAAVRPLRGGETSVYTR